MFPCRWFDAESVVVLYNALVLVFYMLCKDTFVITA